MSRRGLIALLAAVVLAAPAIAAPALSGRMTLTEAIGAVRDAGHDVIYSSELVKPWMRVRRRPTSEEPLAALAEALSVYGLALEAGPQDRWLVVAGDPPPAPVAPAWTARGRVVHAVTGTGLAGVRVAGAQARAVTATDGAFVIEGLRGRTAALAVRGAGFEPAQHPVSATAAGGVVIALEPIELRPLEEVVVVASRHSLFDSIGTAPRFLSGEQIRVMPHLADDVYRAFHRMPGVAATDYSAPFHLRGGALDEVKVRLDGLELFEPFHMRSFFSPLSIVDPGIVGEAEVLAGGFTVRHGNHISGVLDLTSREAQATEHEIGVSFLNAFGRSRGRFADDRGHYLVSVRRGYLDLLADRVADDDERLDPRYHDVYARSGYRLRDDLAVTLHVLHAADDVIFLDSASGEKRDSTSDLSYAWASAEWDVNDRLAMRTVVSAGDVETVADGHQDNPPAEVISRYDARDVELTGVDSEWSLQASHNHLLRFGARYRHLRADYDYRLDAVRRTLLAGGGGTLITRRDLQPRAEGDEWGVWAAWRVRPVPALTTEVGLRWDRQTYTDLSDDDQTSPRFNLAWRVGARTELRAGWGVYHQPQGIEQLQVQDGETRFHEAERADQTSIGVSHRFGGDVELRADLYDKRYRDLRPRYENVLDVYEFAPESNFDRVRVDPDSARARGLELSARRERDEGLDWWLSYTWSEVEDTIGGVEVRRSWDQRHALTASLTWQGPRWSVSAVGHYRSGWPTTPLLVDAVLDDAGAVVGIDTDLSLRNTDEFDAYSRVDLRVSRRVPTARGRFNLFFELYNVFDSENQCCVENVDVNLGGGLSASPSIDSYLPFFPSFGFSWTFGGGDRAASR